MLSGLGAILMQVVNAVLAALVAVVNALLTAWPIGMPTLPTIPAGLLDAFGWIAWSPVPISAMFDFLVFAVSVWTVWLVARPILRWAKVED